MPAPPTDTAFHDVVRRGPFALIYWMVTGGAILAVVGSYFIATEEQRLVIGPVAFAAIVVVICLRYVLAANLRKKRTAQHSRET
ncbi:hypothetical protein [Leifsonia aquatica]|uniref:hypothetical protein n=1 Tax=Leifsonia aquatica TaxID=144185 RepID=UPI00381859B1